MRFKGLCAAVALAVGLSGTAQAAPVLDIYGGLQANQTAIIPQPLENGRLYYVTAKFESPVNLATDYQYRIEKYEIYRLPDGTIKDYSDDLGRTTVRPYTSSSPSQIHKFSFVTPAEIQGKIDRSDFFYQLVYDMTNVRPFRISASGSATYSPYHITITSPVPEPSAWAIMILGLGTVGMAMRRRTRLQPQPS